MKKVCTSDWWLLQTTLALMLLLVVMACENDDPKLPAIDNGYISAGLDVNVVAGESVTLSPSVNQLFHQAELNWRILSQPDNSQVVLINSNKAKASFQPDVAGKYLLELTASLNGQQAVDTIRIDAYSVEKLEGGYRELHSVNGSITKLVVFQGNLYAIGNFSLIGGINANWIASYNGTSWSPLGTGLQSPGNGGYFVINDLLEYNNELYVTGGPFSVKGYKETSAIASWDGSSWKPLGDTDKDFLLSASVMEVFQDELYIGGYFVGGDKLIKWDGNLLKGVSSPLTNINDLVVYKNNLYATGSIGTGFAPGVGFETYRPVIAAFNGSEWSELPWRNNIELDTGFDDYGIFNNLTVFGDKLYATANNFDDGVSDIIGSELIIWDGTQFEDIGRPFSLRSKFEPFSSTPLNLIQNIQIINDELYVAGFFDAPVVGTATNGMVKLNGQKWFIVPTTDGSASVKAIQQFKNAIYIAGSFGQSNSNKIAVWQQ